MFLSALGSVALRGLPERLTAPADLPKPMSPCSNGPRLRTCVSVYWHFSRIPRRGDVAARARADTRGMNTPGTITETVRFCGRVFLDSGSCYEPGTEVSILGRVENCYLVRFPKGEETYMHTDTVKEI